MATLSSTSTLVEVQAAYDDNAGYAEDGSAAMARTFITACRILLRRVPKRASHGGRGAEEVELDPTMIREELKAAQQWLATDPVALGDSGTGARFASFADFRE